METVKVIPDRRGGLSASDPGHSVWSLLRLPLSILLGVPVLLAIDSPYGDTLFSGHGQAVANLLVFLVFLYAYRRRGRRVREIMLIGMFVGLALEFSCSIVLGAYHYRFGNIPLWIAFGHGLIYASSFRLSNRRVFKRRKGAIQPCLLAFIALYSLFWLFADHDRFGFLLTLIFFLVLLAAKKSRFFFTVMFLIVAYIEQVGTGTGCWHWPGTMFGIQGWLVSGNPPVGVAVGYYLFDAGVMFIYLNLLHPNVKRRYLALNGALPETTAD